MVMWCLCVYVSKFCARAENVRQNLDRYVMVRICVAAFWPMLEVPGVRSPLNGGEYQKKSVNFNKCTIEVLEQVSS